MATSGTVDTGTASALDLLIRTSTFAVSGLVASAVSAGVGGLSVRLVDKNVGGDVVAGQRDHRQHGRLQLSPCVIGAPTLRGAPQIAAPDLQTQVIRFGANAAVTIVAVSAVAIGAKSPLKLDIALPAATTGLASEYEAADAHRQS